MSNETTTATTASPITRDEAIAELERINSAIDDAHSEATVLKNRLAANPGWGADEEGATVELDAAIDGLSDAMNSLDNCADDIGDGPEPEEEDDGEDDGDEDDGEGDEDDGEGDEDDGEGDGSGEE